MKIKETFLCILLLIFVFFDLGIPNFSFEFESVQASAYDYPIKYTSSDISDYENLPKDFQDTPLIENNALNIDNLLSASSPLKNDYFILSYNDLAVLTKETVFKLSKVKINAELDKIKVEGNENQATVTMNVNIKINKQNALTKLVGLSSDSFLIVVGANIALNEKSVSTFFEIENLDLSPFVMKIACSYLFGEKDFDDFAKNLVYKIVWNLGSPCSFSSDGLIYNA